MIRIITPVGALLLSVSLLLAGNGLQGTLLPVRAHIEAFSTFSIGFMGSTYFGGFAVGCLLGPYLVRRVGHIRTFAAMAAVASAMPLAHALIAKPAPWWLFRIFTGFCIAVLFMVIESWLNERSSKENRGAILAVYLIINMTVMMLGQMMMNLSAPDTFVLFALASMLVSVAAVPVALSMAPQPAPIERARVRFAHLYRISPVGFFGCFAVGIANGSFWSLAPLFAQRSGFDVSGIALFMSAAVLGGAIGQWPIGRLSDKLDRRRVMLVTCLAAAGCAIAIALLAPGAGRHILALTALWGFFTFPIYSLAVAHINDFAAPDEFVEVSSGVLFVYAGGAIAGPLLSSGLMDGLGAPFLYAFIALVHAVLAAFVVWRMKRRAPVAASDQVPFIDALEATQTVSTVWDQEIQDALVEDAKAHSTEAPGAAADLGADVPRTTRSAPGIDPDGE